MSDKKSTKQKKKTEEIYDYETVIKKTNGIKSNNPKLFESLIKQFSNLMKVKKLNDEQIKVFFNICKEKSEKSWLPFLTKIILLINPDKMGNNTKVAQYVSLEAKIIFEGYNVSFDEVIAFVDNYFKNESSTVISDFLNKYKETIPEQDLAILTFICFTITNGQYPYNKVKHQIAIDKAIVDFFYKSNDTELPKKVLGNILSSKVFSKKKISELAFLYDGYNEAMITRDKAISEQKQTLVDLSAEIAELNKTIEKMDTDKTELLAQIKTLTEENDQHKQGEKDAENKLEFEKNKFDRQLESTEAGIAKQLAEEIELDMTAIKELVEDLDEDNKRRFNRRIERIERSLNEFKEV